ncbi:hypothetical protein PACTADRAFT_47880 [Pachysolen tannophilus NRRL Y-2460]|uniref:dolichyl-diphosphooligosaccharide--protein glycotransferase n=1 Tax=Pachysolen tannophilus NRRL Y-2460 TaxID=669874 RepID=A0A1E4U2B8_PACTA|nr:hypothetical protein PACTADRAFT_47880 [Pachysolen tannophilus NRRL Y-2460]
MVSILIDEQDGSIVVPSFFLKLIKSLLIISIFISISIAAISSRLFSVIRFESIIHEFDPWFNYRATKYLVKHGFNKFLNWFDDKTWYPLGRVTGGTLYPGLMVTSGVIKHFLNFVGLPIDIRNICVLLAPAFSSVTSLFIFFLTNEITDHNTTASLFSAIFMGITPGYISRSVAGSYDNEAIAITLLMATFYFWIKAIKLGSIFWGSLTSLFYFYMVSAWGGYVFITNLIPLHVFVLLLMGRFDHKVYVSYTTWYVLGTLMSMQIPFVGFLPIKSNDHMASFGVFGLLQLVLLASYFKSTLSAKSFKKVIYTFGAFVFILGITGLVAATHLGLIAPWTGRFYSLWDTNYAKVHIPIIASVSEHQPTPWSAFYFDLNFLIWLFPVGVWLCFNDLSNQSVFVIIYSVLGSYFAGVMIRLMLTLAPIVCVCGGIAVGKIFEVYLNIKDILTNEIKGISNNNSGFSESNESTKKSKKNQNISSASTIATTTATTTTTNNTNSNTTTNANTKNKKTSEIVHTFSFNKDTLFQSLTKLLVSGTFIFYLWFYVHHCTWVTSNAYSSPSVVLASRNPDGSQHLIDDYREAYYWLRMNTPEDSKVMAWWDYGYQIGGMADRTTLVDNNTWNNTHIATVGRAMATTEEKSEEIMRSLDVDYILVIFGGLIGFSGDDLNKFLWMVRISEGIWPEEIRERSYFTDKGEYRIDDLATSAMRNSLLYKLSYYRFGEVYSSFGSGPTTGAADRSRNQRLSLDYAKSIQINSVEEVFTSENWIVRIYKLKDKDNFGRQLSKVGEFDRIMNDEKITKRNKKKMVNMDRKPSALRE